MGDDTRASSRVVLPAPRLGTWKGQPSRGTAPPFCAVSQPREAFVATPVVLQGNQVKNFPLCKVNVADLT